MSVESSLTDSFFNDMYSEDPTKVKKAEITKLIREQIANQKDTAKSKSDEYKLQNDLVLYVLDRVKMFVKKTEGEHNKPQFKKFIKFCLDLVKIHTDRIETYLYSIDISKIENQDVRAEEIKLTKDCHAGSNRIEEVITNLNIKEDQATEGIQWLEGQKATIAMHETLVGQYPEIKVKLDSMGINLKKPLPKTIHVLNENPPIYNPNKNYWEQEKDVLQYFFDEYRKIEEGVEIDGYYIDGWLYFHFNYFVTNIPNTVEINGIKENKDKTIVPILRDNEIMITSYFIKSKREQTMSLIAATRRAAKTTLNSSRIARAQVLNRKQILCAGGSSEDLNHIHNNLDTCYQNINDAFKLNYLSPTEDGRGKCYGIKTKANKSKITTNVFIINLEGGTKKSKKESLAGFTPDEFILDEAMKFEYKAQLDALKPALWGDGVLRCSVLITGTGGDSDLAADAIKMLNQPENNKITLMDWDELERNVAPELITWKRRKYGLFLPTQMSIKHKKIESNLADYLGIESETLSKIPLMVTDWKTAKEEEDKERALAIADRLEYIRLLAYHPYDPDEIFLSGTPSPFANVVELAKEHKLHLIESGKWDRRRELRRNHNGKIEMHLSTKPLVEFPFTGSNQDAPFLIIEPPDFDVNPLYWYFASGDFYKQETAPTTDSVCTISVMKYPIFGDQSGKKIVATYAARPPKFKILHENILMLLELYNARFFPENEDMGQFVTYLEERHLEDVYLEKHIDFNGTLTYSENSARKYGQTAKQSKRKLIAMYANYLEEDVQVKNEVGEMITLKRVQTIDDIHHLQEIISYTENGNYDRISGTIGNVGFCHFLEKNYIYPKGAGKKLDEEEKPKERVERKPKFYSERTRRGFYSNKKR